MNIKILTWIRTNTHKEFQKDVLMSEFFYKQRKDKEYLHKVKSELIKDIIHFKMYVQIIGAEFLHKRKDELKYINYLIKN